MGFFKLSQAVKYLAPLKINSELCLLNISPLSSCYKCADICPKQGLSFSEGVWQYEDCNDCGLCAAVCPQRVFGLDREKAAAISGEKVLLSCTENDNTADNALICQCLQQFTIEEILKLAAQNEALAIYAPSAICEKCAKGFSAEALKFRLDKLKLGEEIAFLHNEEELSLWKNDNKIVENLSRRRFLASLSGKGQHEIKRLAEKALDETGKNISESLEIFNEEKTFTAPKIAAEREAVRTLLKKKAAAEITLPYHSLASTACIFCAACVKLCPTNALQMTENTQGEKLLTFSPYLCSECDLCLDICPTKGFYWDELSVEKFLSDSPQILAQAAKQICEKCGEEFWQYPEHENICRFCRN